MVASQGLRAKGRGCEARAVCVSCLRAGGRSVLVLFARGRCGLVCARVVRAGGADLCARGRCGLVCAQVPCSQPCLFMQVAISRL